MPKTLLHQNALSGAYPTTSPKYKTKQAQVFNRHNPMIVEVDAGNVKNTRYTICERTYTSRKNYTSHMYYVHKNGKREPAARRDAIKAQFDPNIIPIWGDQLL